MNYRAEWTDESGGWRIGPWCESDDAAVAWWMETIHPTITAPVTDLEIAPEYQIGRPDLGTALGRLRTI